jgi:hypothetical protein
MGKGFNHPWGDPFLGRLRRDQVTKTSRQRLHWEANDAWQALDSEQRGRIIEAWFHSRPGNSRRAAKVRPEVNVARPAQKGLFEEN